MSAPSATAAVAAADGEHLERPARAGEFCDFCRGAAFVVYLTAAGPVRWCGQPETPQEKS